MMGGLAAVAMPVAIALAADQAIKGVVKSAMSGIGGILKGAASPDDDPSKAIEGLSSAVSSFGEKLPGPIGQMAVAVGEAGKIFSGLMQSFTKQADKYAEYNPQIAQAQAMAEIRQVMGDMRRAQRSSGEIARFIEEQSKMQQQFEEIKMKIWMKILPIITAILQVLSRLLGVLETQEDDQIDLPIDVLFGAQGGVQAPRL